MQHALAVIEAQWTLASLAKISLGVENTRQQTPSQLGGIKALQSTMSSELSPSASALDKLHLISLVERAYAWNEMHLQLCIHALTSESLWMSIDQNQGNDLFHCLHTSGAITAVSIFKSCHSRTLYRLRREASAPRSSIDFCAQLYTWAWCWTVDSTACTSVQARVLSLCIHAGCMSFLYR